MTDEWLILLTHIGTDIFDNLFTFVPTFSACGFERRLYYSLKHRFVYRIIISSRTISKLNHLCTYVSKSQGLWMFNLFYNQSISLTCSIEYSTLNYQLHRYSFSLLSNHPLLLAATQFNVKWSEFYYLSIVLIF